VLAKQLRLDVAQLTDVGRRREHNEDNMAYVIPKDEQVMTKKGALFIVADGMGGHAAGEVASEIAVDTVSNVYYQDDSDDVAVSLLHAIRRANASIYQRAAENMLRTGMGTTCVAAVLRGNMAYIANVGDSRAYLLRGSQVKQISQDHSWVAEQVRAGLLTEDQARTHAQRNVITRCLGTQAEVDIDVFQEELNDGDSLVLCSDGLSGLISDEELRRIVDQYLPQESVYHLVERANLNGGPDNITAIVVRVHEVGEEPPGVRHPVRVGSRELGSEDTVMLGMLPGTSFGVSLGNSEGRIPGPPLRLSSGPLTSSSDNITAPQPVLGKTPRSRNRFVYPTLALVALLIIAGFSGGVYVFLHVNDSQAVVNQTLSSTQMLIIGARTDLDSNNPTSALSTLAHAQKNLQDVQKNHQLDGSQQQQLMQLQRDLATQVKAAIANYNQSAHILVCVNMPNLIGTTSTQTSPQSIALAQDSTGAPALYALGQDNGLYQVNGQYSLINPIRSSASSRILNVSGYGSRVFVLVEQLKNAEPAGYTLDVYQPGKAGALGTSIASAPIGSQFTKDGYVPALITAGENTVYVVLNSNSNQGNTRVLSYTVDAKGHPVQPKPLNFPLSAAVVSAAAFSQQLFLLLADGAVFSLSLLGGNQPTLPTAVFVQAPIALPLNFTDNEPVPTVTPVEQKGSTPLVVSGASAEASNASSTSTAMLAAGLVSGISHLYIGDPVNHRVLDLDVAASAGGPTTPTPAPRGTAVAGSNVKLQLMQQYVLPTGSSQVKSLAVDPKGARLDILSQNTPSVSTLTTVSTATQNGC
jgi:serine/threonine protein phosphatase PrpC